MKSMGTSFPFKDLPTSFQEIKSPRVGFLSLDIADDHIAKVQQATMHVFSEKSRKKGVNPYILIRTLLLISSTIKHSDDPKLVKTQDLPTLLEKNGNSIPRGSIRSSLQKLVEKQLITVKTIDNPFYPNGQWQMYEFTSIADLEYLIEELSFRKLSPKDKSKNSRIRDTEAQNSILETAKITRDDATLNEEHLPLAYAYIDTLMPKFMFDLAPGRDGAHNKDYAIAEVDGYTIEAKGHKKINTKPALITALILMRIAIAYNSKMISQGKFLVPFEKSEVPIFTNDLMLYKGSDGGDARARVASEIEMLRNTVYDIHDTAGKFNPNSKRSEYETKDFRFIESISSTSEEKFKGSDPEAQARSASLYVIRFSKRVEELMSDKKFFFALPVKLITENTILVTLYLYLRRLSEGDHKISLKQLATDLPFNGTENALLERLENMLTKNYPSSKKITITGDTDSDNSGVTEHDFNFFGYHIKFTKNTAKPYMSIWFDNNEIIRQIGVTLNEKKETNAPTMPNPLYYLSCSTEDIKIQSAYNAIKNSLNKSFITSHSVRSQRHRCFKIDGEIIVLSAYSTDKEISSLAGRLATLIDVPLGDLTHVLGTMASELNSIQANNIHISRSDIDRLIEAVKLETGSTLSTGDIVMLTVRYRTKKLTDWKEGRLKEIVAHIKRNMTK